MIHENYLDNAPWYSLVDNHRHLGTIGEKAAVYDPQISMMAGLKEETYEAYSELATLATIGIPQFLVAHAPENHPDWNVLEKVDVNQMVCNVLYDYNEMNFEELTARDVPEMINLVELTDPGPFSQRTIEMGRYIGVKVDGRLVAMGGERLNPGSYVELSGICTHPDFRGRGFAMGISGELSRNIIERGLVPFLYVKFENVPANRLYEKLGFSSIGAVPGCAIMKKV